MLEDMTLTDCAVTPRRKIEPVRVSSYLNRVDIDDDQSLLFGGATLCMDLVPREYAERLCTGQDVSFLSNDERQYLTERGHLTNLSVSRELAEFRKTVQCVTDKIQEVNEKNGRGNLSFILTYKCNLSCTYCYQQSVPDQLKSQVMTPEFVDEFFNVYFSQLYPKLPKQMRFTLFGGEPLLPQNHETIRRILHYAKKYDSVQIDVATNAVFLPELLDQIGSEDGKIQSVQITLDGDKDLHDGTRIPSSGKPTFETMVAAIRQVLKTGAHVGIRVHLHPSEQASARRLMEFLAAESLLDHPQIAVYFSPINTYLSSQNSSEEFARFCQLFQDVASKTRRPPSQFMHLKKFVEMETQKILPKVRYCGLGGTEFFVIDPFGDIYQCYEEAGHPRRRIGKLDQGQITYFPLKKSYEKRAMLNLPECLRCPLALFCGGGCPIQAKSTKGSIFKAHCHQNKDFIHQTLRALILQKQTAAS